MICVPSQPSKEEHQDQGQCSGQPRQRAHQQCDTEQDLTDGGQHAQFKGVRCPGLEVQCARLEILFELIHEAHGIVDFDESRDDEEGAHEHAAEVGDR